MHAYHLNTEELNIDIIHNIKGLFHAREIVILPKADYAEMEKVRYNAEYTEELQTRINELAEGKGIVKTMAELEALADA